MEIGKTHNGGLNIDITSNTQNRPETGGQECPLEELGKNDNAGVNVKRKEK